MPRQINDRQLVLLRRSGSRTGAAVVGVIVVAGAAIRLGVAPEYLEWLPQAEKVFASRRGGYHWTTVHLAGTIEQPQQDLSPRIIDALKESPAAFLALVFRSGRRVAEGRVRRGVPRVGEGDPNPIHLCRDNFPRWTIAAGFD